WLDEAFGVPHEARDEVFVFPIEERRTGDVVQLVIRQSELLEAVTKLNELSRHEDTVLYSDFSYEVLVKPVVPGKIPARYVLERIPPTLKDTVNQITYHFGSPSNEYLLYLLSKSVDNGALDSRFPRFLLQSFMRRLLLQSE